MIKLSRSPIDTSGLAKQMTSRQSGAFLSFEGRVRDHNEGRSVERLEYEAYEELAIKEGEKIIQEAQRLYPIIEARAVHRLGSLEIGEAAVWVAVISRHRGEAFEACRYIIDQIKLRLPIWKKEFYTDGNSSWVNCAHCHDDGSSGAALAREKSVALVHISACTKNGEHTDV